MAETRKADIEASAPESESEQKTFVGSEPETEQNAPVKDGLSGPPPGMPSFPEGGLQAWLAVLGSFCILFCTFGYLQSFGIYEEYYATHQLSNYSASTISWIGSLQVFLMFGGGIIAGPLFDRYGTITIGPASLAYVVSVVLTSFCYEYYQFILAQAVLGGICLGFLFSPSVAVVSHYFLKKRGMAIGICVAGSSLGGVIFPVLLNQLLYIHNIGFGWSVRACALIMLVLLGIASLVTKPRLTPRKNPFPFALMQRPIYILTIIGVFLMIWGMYIPFFYIPTWAVYVGVSEDLAPYVVAVMNATSLVGRIAGGILSDKLGRFNMLAVVSIVSAILLFMWAVVTTSGGVMVISALSGIFVGAIVSIFATCVAQITPHPKDIGSMIGISQFIWGFAGLSGSPIAGAILSRTHSFNEPAYFGAASLLAGAAILMVGRYVGEPNLRKPF